MPDILYQPGLPPPPLTPILVFYAAAPTSCRGSSRGCSWGAPRLPSPFWGKAFGHFFENFSKQYRPLFLFHAFPRPARPQKGHKRCSFVVPAAGAHKTCSFVVPAAGGPRKGLYVVQSLFRGLALFVQSLSRGLRSGSVCPVPPSGGLALFAPVPPLGGLVLIVQSLSREVWLCLSSPSL